MTNALVWCTGRGTWPFQKAGRKPERSVCLRESWLLRATLYLFFFHLQIKMQVFWHILFCNTVLIRPCSTSAHLWCFEPLLTFDLQSLPFPYFFSSFVDLLNPLLQVILSPVFLQPVFCCFPLPLSHGLAKYPCPLEWSSQALAALHITHTD